MDLGGGAGTNFNFSEYGHVAYQIKGNDACSNMVANSVPVHTFSIPEVGSKVKTLFLRVAAIHIKLKGMKHIAPCKHILCPYTNPQPLGGGGGGQKVKTCFSFPCTHPRP